MADRTGNFVTVFEVGPRDGLQNEPKLIATDDKVALINLLAETGLRKIEVTSFVSPKRVPQLADAADVMGRIDRCVGVRYACLTPNMKGYDRAVAARADEIAVFASASEGFSQANINCSIDESLRRFAPVVDAAADRAMPVRGYVSCVTDCPFDGRVAPEKVLEVASRLIELGCYEVSLGDTLGRATPESIDALLGVVTRRVDPGRLAGHFHDTTGRALDNLAVALQNGVRVFDASVAGLGGCPFAPGSAGNVATESAVRALAAGGYETGIDPDALERAAALARRLVGRAA